ncbi:MULTISPECIES: ABC transporter permease [Peptoniphilus]|uniref:Autoinducer 2 ABC transporter permease LsrC n=1 Tax=Peptoniphilus lacrimalis TaxID=33031 RepID=A0A379C7J6_9FIRM|nr:MULTISPECIES: ABC transporter [Peptoniphilus]EFK39378.1 branched-chain amino acid ABC transporter, permease protein [Peptoniphilus sp. oral taxon 836 str. F0141]MDK7722446.1 ABC transporter permease [Peptoniphilus lacrimalis]MDK7732165.1 ABC transporter permease [Peptoniphilus lacrimalis]MDK8281829.1 ABC transporter permease [Peptoniphilus lacrimalis]SUB57665.1 autoinducer 2 ABC transporter permease LsrC [Peptoniphilus lacrimalis]
MSSVLMESLVTGLIFSILAIGVVITFKILNLADLSVEGTFPLGAFVFAKVLTLGYSPFLAMALAFVMGGVFGYLTYFLYKRLKIDAILAGILTMTILYTVNLRITGTSNVTFYELDVIFSIFSSIPKIVILLIIVGLIKIIMDWFLKTEKGYLLLATGDNERLVKSLGENPNKFYAYGLILSNALVALAGSLMAQSTGYCDITMGQTIIVSALASIVIGDAFLKNAKFLNRTTRAIIGAVVYRVIFGIAISAGLQPSDLKAVTAIIVIIFIVYNNMAGLGISKLRKRKE